MQTAAHVLLALTLVFTGAYAGMTLMCEIGVIPAMRRLSLPAFAEAWRAMDFYLDRSMPPFKITLLLLTLATAIVLRVQQEHMLALCFGFSFLCSLTALILTVKVQLPINKQITTFPADAPQAELERLREKTAANFRLRFYLAVVAFLVPCFIEVFRPAL